MIRAVVVAFLLLATPAWAQPTVLQPFDSVPLVIDTANGPQHFLAELALTPAQQRQGLMFRRHLAPDAGMLFVMPEPQIMHFWMHNTYIPLDMIFIAPGGRIVDYRQRAKPLSDAIIASRAPAIAVLEINGGTVDRLGIKIGDVVRATALGDLAKRESDRYVTGRRYDLRRTAHILGHRRQAVNRLSTRTPPCFGLK